MKRHIVMLLVVMFSTVACKTGLMSGLALDEVYPEAEAPDPSLLEVYSNMIPPILERHWHIHDPTQLVRLGDHWMIGATRIPRVAIGPFNYGYKISQLLGSRAGDRLASESKIGAQRICGPGVSASFPLKMECHAGCVYVLGQTANSWNM